MAESVDQPLCLVIVLLELGLFDHVADYVDLSLDCPPGYFGFLDFLKQHILGLLDSQHIVCENDLIILVPTRFLPEFGQDISWDFSECGPPHPISPQQFIEYPAHLLLAHH